MTAFIMQKQETRWQFNLSRTKKTSPNGNEQLPANKQKGKKVCTCCHKNKNLTEYYLSYSPMYSLDCRVPVCKECCKSSALNEDGTINYGKLKELLMHIDKPMYWDQLSSSYESVKKENSYVSDEEVEMHGYDVLSKYFTLIATRQDRAKSWSDAEKEGFIHTNTNRSKFELENIRRKYSQLFDDGVGKNNFSQNENPFTHVPLSNAINWTDQDLQNKQYAIDVLGYDPFEEYPEEGRKFLFNQLSPYLEDDSTVDDAYKLSQILQIIKNNYQIDICDRKMSQQDPLKDAKSIKTLSDIKNKLVASNDKIAKENEISVKNRSNKDAGKSTLTYLMRELREKDFDKAEADYYDQLRSAGTQWAIDMSIKSIKENGLFDENDKKEIYEMQLDLIRSLNQEVDDLKEKVRLLILENDKLKAEIENGL